MPRYADSMLSNGEQIVMRGRQHWLAPVIDARYPWAMFLASIVLLLLSRNLSDAMFRDIVGYAALIGLIAALAWLAKVYLAWWAQDYMVTNRRVLKVEGIINKRSADSSLEKINDAVLEQNIFARMFNYGDLDILTAADVAIDRYRMLDKAPLFKREMLNQKHELEGEFNRPMPSPPLRAASAPPPPTATPEAAAVGDGTAGASGARHMSADEVTRALASLADLRDRGAISPTEYDSKKSELLSRL